MLVPELVAQLLADPYREDRNNSAPACVHIGVPAHLVQDHKILHILETAVGRLPDAVSSFLDRDQDFFWHCASVEEAEALVLKLAETGVCCMTCVELNPLLP